MSPLTESTRVVLSRIQQYPAVLGEPWGGGYFAGYISHTADGNPTHALIVAPRATGATGTGYTLTTNLAWKTTNTETPGTGSLFDGFANTSALIALGISDFPAASFCAGLSIGSFTDWYLPSPLELDIAYFNLKPGTALNDVSVPTRGINQYAVPRRSIAWTASHPREAYLPAFAAGGSESFEQGLHWTSRSGGTNATYYSFSNGFSTSLFMGGEISVRAFRRIAL